MRIKSLLIAALLTLPVQVWAQGIPIGALPSAMTPLSGSEFTILSQNGTTVKAPVSAFASPILTIPNNTVLGNVSGGTAAATGITAAQLDVMLGLGTAAFQNTGTSGHALPFLDGSNTWSGLQTFSGGISISSLSLTTLNVSGTSTFGTGAADRVVLTGGASAGSIATNAGGLTLAPFSAATAVTGSLSATTTLTAGTGLTVTTGGATISGGGAAITGNTSVSTGTFTASGGADTLSPAGANVVISPTGSGVVTISPATAGTMDNVAIGGSTPRAGTFTSVLSSGLVKTTGTEGSQFELQLGTQQWNINAVSSGAFYINDVTGSHTNFQISQGSSNSLLIGTSTSAFTGPLTSTGAGSFGIGSTDYITATGGSGGGTLSTNGGSMTVSSGAGNNTALSDSAVSLSNAAYHSCTSLNTNSSGVVGCSLTGGVYPAWGGAPQTTNFNAVAGTAYCIDTKTTGAVTMTLPASPADGDQIRFIDCKSNFNIAVLTVARNTKTIMGLAQDMTVNTVNAAATMIYSTTLTDWRMY